jgi:tRNA(fMet)-specific endonuclease VapC
VKFMLDSNAAIYLLNGLDALLTGCVSSCDRGCIVMSVIAFAEVAMVAAKSKPPPMGLLQAFLSEVPLLAFDYAAALAYAKLPFKRARFGRFLAAHALSLGLSVITADECGFADIPGLKVENWTLPLS